MYAAEIARPLGLHYNHYVSPSVRFQLVKMFITLEPHGLSCADPEGGTGGPDPPPPRKITKNIGFLSNTDPEPLKITKLPSQHSRLGQHRPASETPLKWRFAGGPLMARHSGICILPSLIKLKKKINVLKVGTPSDKTFWIRACLFYHILHRYACHYFLTTGMRTHLV